MDNKDTLAAYQKYFDRYIDGTHSVPGETFQVWLQQVFSYTTQDARILEIGTAGGRDADYLESLGYSIVRSDATQAACEYQQSQGHECMLLNILNPPHIDESFDFIFANAVFLHFNLEEMKLALAHVADLLAAEGVFCFSVKSGDGEIISTHKMDTPRYFKNWQADEMNSFLKGNGFEVVENGNAGGMEKWLYFICKKCKE